MQATADRSDARPSEGRLEFRCLGEAEVLLDGGVLRFPTRHALQALFRLALSPDGSVPVVDLTTSLWPDAPESRLGRRLATLTWQVRRTLGDEAGRVARSRDFLRFDRDGVGIDVLEVRRRAVQEHGGDGLSSEVASQLAAPVLPAWAGEPWVAAVEAENAALLARLG
jgi:DNA-binding SARP family transcriptional activator